MLARTAKNVFFFLKIKTAGGVNIFSPPLFVKNISKSDVGGGGGVRGISSTYLKLCMNYSLGISTYKSLCFPSSSLKEKK